MQTVKERSDQGLHCLLFNHTLTHSDTSSHLGLATRKPVFGVSDKARLKPVSSATWTSYKFEISLVAILDMILSNKRITKGADQTERMQRLVCVFVVGKPPKTGFLMWRPFLKWIVCFVAFRPKSTAMVMAGRSIHLTTLFPGQA